MRVINATDWRDLHAIWTAPYVLEGIKLGYAFREGNKWTDAPVMARVRDQR